MKKFFSLPVLASAGLLLLVGCSKQNDFLAPSELNDALAEDRAPGGGLNINGQSVQVNVEGVEQDYIIEEMTTSSFDWNSKPAALAAFDTYFTFTTEGGPNPSNIETAKHNALKDNKCNFWFGSALKVSESNFGARKVTCTPKAPGIYPAKTGWTVETSGNTTVDVDLSNIFIASVSHLKKAKASGGWSKKYSFTMLDGAGVSRLTALSIELLHNGDVLETRVLDPLGIPVESGADWEYASTGDFFGDAAAGAALAFADGQLVNTTQGTNEHDDFSGNNGIGGSRALIGAQSFPGLTLEGNYAVRISGTIKGNGFVSDQSFSITKTVISVNDCE